MADAGRLVGVELFEDRASVTREVPLAAGRHRLRIGPLTPLVTERGLSFPGGAAVVVEEARVERTRTTRVEADPATLQDLERRWRAAQDEADAASDATARAAARTVRATQLVEAALQATPRALCETDAPDAWVERTRELVARTSAAREEQEAAVQRQRRAEEERDRLAADLAAGRAGAPVVQAFLVLSVVAAADGPFQVRYTVPCAVWRPAHRAVLEEGLASPPPRSSAPDAALQLAGSRSAESLVRWEVRGVCWNATGEDWVGARLTCSTARPGDLAEPPALLDDVLTARRRPTEVVVEARDEEILVARERGARSAAEVPGVDDGGEPRTFRVERPVDLPSTGRPIVVTLEAWTAEAVSRWVAIPERAPVAVRRTLQRNTGSRPLLAGPVELVANGVAVGRGKVDLVAPGEPFPLGWGSHDGLRLSRRVEQEARTAMITGRQARTTKVEIRVSHLGDAPCRLEVRERVPTSELKEVTVSAPRAEPALDAPMDADGFCRWTLELAPGETRKLALEFTIDASSNVRLP